ncbi:hypothetical protein LTR10_017292 [Elasticomyces elasticus]|uniref:Uncharacterized protein n=1 Tax=Exophiala sideris TaxID=1016849 RepID=A0ABR0JHV0_9EURO|nr:hypothetical protein LTR10_017292 [Elasticomyces elasticus]KAK5034147.1 hypothetical protein LTS07_003067 [Exophiala sideris]KAK5042443.1 hypothetical protein LTR13_001290 [Exophiala sideris]KAK5065525.1 hypothetical protein LTR69_003074 [Exophiala sideris]KAK5186016.1 hypothetical protein LTR44_002065 [Eurotiomycetes sp. CCFEE 6388]
MRALWSQIPRPRLSGSPSISSIETVNSNLVRKTTTAPLRRRATFNDAFTLLLAPVLAAVFIVDTSWKGKQRRDWDERLSVIQEEINQIHEREQRIKSALRLRARSNGILSQRRGYATAAHAHVDFDDGEVEVEVPTWEDDGMTDEGMPQIRRPVSHEATSLVQDLEPARVYKDGMFSPEEMANFHRYHRLNAIMLSLRMLLHLQIGPSPFFALAPDETQADTGDLTLRQDPNQLVELLRVTRTEMRRLKNRRELFVVSTFIDSQASRSELSNRIRTLTTSFDAGNITLSELINGFGQSILQTKEVPSTMAYVMLIRSLSKVGSFSLAYHVMGALKSSTLPLSDDAIFHILFQIGQACDSRSLNHILPLITRSDEQLNVASKWERTIVNDIELPVPSSLDVRLLQVLVYTALRCQQPERAEAWMSMLREMDYGSFRKNHLFRSFLAYYTMHGNWEKGKIWLRRAVEHASSIAAYTADGFTRMIYRMLDLCVRCRKLPEYTMILEASVAAGIRPPRIQENPNNRRVIYPRGRSILLEWDSIPAPEHAERLPVDEKIRCFQTACQPLVDHIHDGPVPTNRALQDEGQDELVLMPPTPHALRYAVRRQLKKDPADSAQDKLSGSTLLEQAKVQARFQYYDHTIRSLKASLDVSDARYKAALEAGQDRTDNTVQLGKTTADLQEQLKESQQAMEQLQVQNQSYAQEHAQLRNEINDLKEIAKRLMAQQQEQRTSQKEPAPSISRPKDQSASPVEASGPESATIPDPHTAVARTTTKQITTKKNPPVESRLSPATLKTAGSKSMHVILEQQKFAPALA